MQEPKFETIGAVREDLWSVKQFHATELVMRAGSGDRVEFNRVALFRFVPSPRRANLPTSYDKAPPGLSSMTGYRDNQDLYGQRIDDETPRTFVLRTPSGNFIVFAAIARVVQDGREVARFP